MSGNNQNQSHSHLLGEDPGISYNGNLFSDGKLFSFIQESDLSSDLSAHNLLDNQSPHLSQNNSHLNNFSVNSNFYSNSSSLRNPPNSFVNHSLPHISLASTSPSSSTIQVYGNPTPAFSASSFPNSHNSNGNNNNSLNQYYSNGQYGFSSYSNPQQDQTHFDRERKRNLSSEDYTSVPSRSRSVSPKRDASSSPSGHTKRGWESWNMDEMENFFTSLQRDGRDFEKITSNVQTKNYDQVRYFYYRILNKILKLLKPNKIDKKDPKEVMNALFSFWELRKAAKNKDEEYTPAFAMALKEKIAATSKSMTLIGEEELESEDKKTEVRRGRKKSVDEPPRGRSLSANPMTGYSTHLSASNIPSFNTILVQDHTYSAYSTPSSSNHLQPSSAPFTSSQNNSIYYQPQRIHSTNELLMDSASSSRNSTTPGIIVNPVQFSPNRNQLPNVKTEISDNVEKVTVQLVPRNAEVASILSSNQQNPRLQLTMKGTKTVSFLTDFLVQKWVIRSEEGSTIPLTNGDIIFYPRMNAEHLGWSAKESGEICLSMLANMQPVLKLEYCWAPFLYNTSVPLRSPSGSLSSSSLKPSLSALENYSSLSSAIHSPTMQGNYLMSPSPHHSPNVHSDVLYEQRDLYTPDHPSKQSPYYMSPANQSRDSPAHDVIYARQVQDSFAAVIQDLGNPLDDPSGAFDLSGSNNDLSFILKSEKFLE